jgi:hypothetical protein
MKMTTKALLLAATSIAAFAFSPASAYEGGSNSTQPGASIGARSAHHARLHQAQHKQRRVFGKLTPVTLLRSRGEVGSPPAVRSNVPVPRELEGDVP